MTSVWIVNHLLGEVYEGDDKTLKAVCTSEAIANDIREELITAEMNRPHWHPSWTEQGKRESSERYYNVIEVPIDEIIHN